jgi:hypothetical protein
MITLIKDESGKLQQYANWFYLGPFPVNTRSQEQILAWEMTGKLEYVDYSNYINLEDDSYLDSLTTYLDQYGAKK